jgi:hypothetical protein
MEKDVVSDLDELAVGASGQDFGIRIGVNALWEDNGAVSAFVDGTEDVGLEWD